MIQALNPLSTNVHTFTIFHNDISLGQFQGIKDRDSVGEFIDFIYQIDDITVGDKIVDVAKNEYIVTGIDKPKNMSGNLTTRSFKVYCKSQPQMPSPLINNVINVNNTNSTVLENNIDISISIQTTYDNIKNMDSLSDEETKLALEKVNELATILQSKENRKSKWSKIASVFKWLANKSVELATAFSPLIIQALQNIH